MPRPASLLPAAPVLPLVLLLAVAVAPRATGAVVGVALGVVALTFGVRGVRRETRGGTGPRKPLEGSLTAPQPSGEEPDVRRRERQAGARRVQTPNTPAGGPK